MKKESLENFTSTDKVSEQNTQIPFRKVKLFSNQNYKIIPG